MFEGTGSLLQAREPSSVRDEVVRRIRGKVLVQFQFQRTKEQRILSISR
jgi:hypothetical protein